MKDPQAEEHVFRTLEIVDRAVATSGGYGTPFEPTGRFNHLFDPPTGRCSDRYLSVTVVAPDATTADGLSTAFSLMPIEAARTVLAAVPDGAAIFMLPDRSVSTIGL